MTKEEILELARIGAIRIFLYPRVVTSKTDGQSHFIGFDQLRSLYGLPNVGYIRCYPTSSHEFMGFRELDTDLVLYPSYHGNYDLNNPTNNLAYSRIEKLCEKELNEIRTSKLAGAC